MSLRHAGLAFFVMVVGIPGWGSEASQPKVMVSATGSATIIPSALEVVLTLKEKSEDVKGALLNLKAAREKIAAKLVELGASTDQIKPDIAAIVEKNPNAQRQMVRSSGRLKRADKPEKEKPEIQMQQFIRAFLPLKGKDAEAVTAEAEELKAKIKAAKLLEEKSAEAGGEGEIEEETLEYQNDGQNNAPLNFWYYALMNEEAQQKAFAEALGKARASAALAAKALGKTAADLSVLNVVTDGSGLETHQTVYFQYTSNVNQNWNQGLMPSALGSGICSLTASMTLPVHITVEFLLK